MLPRKREWVGVMQGRDMSSGAHSQVPTTWLWPRDKNTYSKWQQTEQEGHGAHFPLLRVSLSNLKSFFILEMKLYWWWSYTFPPHHAKTNSHWKGCFLFRNSPTVTIQFLAPALSDPLIQRVIQSELMDCRSLLNADAVVKGHAEIAFFLLC